MQLTDLLQVMREEFAGAADDVDAEIAQWMGEGLATAEQRARALADQFERLAQTARVIALEGHAVALELLRDNAQLLAFGDEQAMGEGLGWLALWRDSLQACFDAPGDAQANDALVGYVAMAPSAPPPELLTRLRELLALAPALPDGGDAASAPLPAATADDVSLAIPGDVDHGLLEAFLAEAPPQLAQLGEVSRELSRGAVAVERLVEAQRVAHTFKGSGNIIGIRGVARLAHRIEDLFEHAIALGGALPGAPAHDVEQAVATLDQMIFALRGEEEPPQTAQLQLQALLDWINALRDGSFDERAQSMAVRPASAPSNTAASGDSTSPAATVDAATLDAQLRVSVTRLERLVRRAGQGLVQGGRLDEHLRLLEQRLAALEANNLGLRVRLRELEGALERQGVNLKERAQEQGGSFDPLEMDRYNELHALSRFVTEAVADELEITRAARDDARAAQATLREHGQDLKEQHHELLGARLVPFRQIVARLRRNVSQTAAATAKRVRLEVDGDSVQLDADVLDRLTEPLLHLLRNAVDHGIEPPEERLLFGKDEEGVVRLQVQRHGRVVRIECRDDGRGLNLDAIRAKAIGLGLIDDDDAPDDETLMRLILLPGFSTRDQVTEVSGRGVGMDVVADRLRAMKGHVAISSLPLEGSCFTLQVPATIGSAHALVVRVGTEFLALPTESVVMALAAGQGTWRDGRLQYGEIEARGVDLAKRLGLVDDESTGSTDTRPVVLIDSGGETLAAQVDAVLDARELILQDIGRMLRHLAGVSAGALRSDGRVMFVLDTELLRHDVGVHGMARAAAAQLRSRAQVQRTRVLVVDDALSVRKALTQLLEDAGYEVESARDGFEALEAIQRRPSDIVLTDLEMPNLNGLDLTRRLRQEERTRATPVLMITSRSSDKHRHTAAEAGVTSYLTKPYTDDALLGQVRELLAA